MLADLMGPASWSGWHGPITNLMLRDTTQGNMFQYFSYIMNRISNKNIIYILYCTRARFYAKKHHWLNVTIPCHHCTCLKWCVNWLQPSCKWHIWIYLRNLGEAVPSRKPMLARGELCCIGATTVDEYRKYIEKDAALERRFQQVTVEDGAGWSWIQMDWCGLIWINMD